LVLGLFTAGELLDETLGSAAGFGNEGDGRVIVGKRGRGEGVETAKDGSGIPEQGGCPLRIGSGTTRAETGHGSISGTLLGPQAAAAGSAPSA
jgi:hypothetical protein